MGRFISRGRFEFVAQSLFDGGEAEGEMSPFQHGRLDAGAGEEKLFSHLAEEEADGEGRHGEEGGAAGADRGV
mgnify:CR=1 FL=1